MKKITFMLLAFFAAASVNAQTGPMKASQMGNSTTVDELVGWFYWYNRTTTSDPVKTTEEIKELYNDLYDASTNPEGKARNNNRYVCFSKIDKDSILIHNLFELPVRAKVNFKTDGTGVNNIDIPIGQKVAYDVEKGDIYLWQTTWYVPNDGGESKWVTYTTVRMYSNHNSWYISNNWIQLYSLDGEEKVPYGSNYIPGFAYSYSRVASAYADWNAVMYVTFDKVIQNYPYTTYPVNVTQKGDVVKVQNFNGGVTTVNIDLKAGNKLIIEPQTGTFGTSGTEYTYYPAVGGGIVGPDLEGKIEGTGTEDRLSWGDYCRVSEAYTYQYETGEIIFLNKDLNKFTFPEEDPMSINDIETENEVSGATYNVAGQKVDGNYRGIVIQNGKKLIRK